MEEKSLPDNRPTDYEYALLAQHAYKGEKISAGDNVDKIPDWEVHSIMHNSKDAYFGVIYINHDKKQIVLAHRGSNTVQSFVQDAKEIYFNKTEIDSQKEDAFALTHKSVQLLNQRNKNRDISKCYRLSFTGHSLGAFLAELSVYYCHWNFGFKLGEINALTFESPGCFETLELIKAHHPQGQIDLQSLDVVSYLSYPNLVNTCNRHVGTAYAVQPNLGQWGWFQGNHLLQAHSLNNMIALFKDEAIEGSYILDWPLGTAVFPGGWSERDYFFKHARFENGYYCLPQDNISRFDRELEQSDIRAKFEQSYKAHYKVDGQLNNKNLLPLIHFTPDMSLWLKQFYAGLVLYKNVAGEEASPNLVKFAQEHQISKEVISHLLIFQIIKVGKAKLLYVDSSQSSIQQFRHTLSQLWTKPEQVMMLLEFVANGAHEKIPDLEVIGAEDVVIEQGANVTNKATLIYKEFPEGASKETIDRLNESVAHDLRLIKELQFYGKTVGMKGGRIHQGAHASNVSVGEEHVAKERQFLYQQSTQQPVVPSVLVQPNQLPEQKIENLQVNQPIVYSSNVPKT